MKRIVEIWRRMHNSWHYVSYIQKINTYLCLENMLHFISFPLYMLRLYYKCKIVFSMSDRICAILKTEIYSLHCDWAKFLKQGGFVFNLLFCCSHGNCPGAVWYTPCAWNCDYTPNVSDGRSIKAGAGRRILESRQCPDGDTQFNLNAYYLFWVSHTSCLVKQGDHFFSLRGLKSRYTVSLTVNTKWIPQALYPHWKILLVFRAAIVIAVVLMSLKNTVCVHNKNVMATNKNC